MSSRELTFDEKCFMDDLSAFGQALFSHSCTVEAQVGTPKAVSLMLFNRLWSNYRGYVVLWKAGHTLEAQIVLRAAIESTICISANAEMGEAFYSLLLGDLAATIKKLIKIWRDMDAGDLVKSYEARLRSLPAGTPEKPTTFSWDELAKAGGMSRLYEQHRFLSATSSHVTALSVMRGVTAGEGSGEALQSALLDIEGANGPMLACCALLIGCKYHANIVGSNDFCAGAAALESQFSVLSARWHGNHASETSRAEH